MTLNQELLDVCGEALCLLRQDVNLPTLAAAATDTGMDWVKCRRAVDYSAAEILAAHDWAFIQTNVAAGQDVAQWPMNLRKVLVYCLARDLAVQIAGRTEDMKNLHQLYGRLLTDARLRDLETGTLTDAVAREVVATLRGFFSAEATDLPRSLMKIYTRYGAVKTTAFEEVKAAHGWTGKATIASGEQLPPIAKAAWILLIEKKLAVSCGLSPEAAARLGEEYRQKLREARVADLETTPVPAGLEGEVITLIRESFDVSETNLPMDLKTIADRVTRMKKIAMGEVLSAHPWAFATEETPAVSHRLTGTGYGEYRWEAATPDGCLRIVGAYGRDGELLKWERLADALRANGEIVRVKYVCAVEDLDEFPPDAYRLVVLRLAADLTRAMSLRASVQNLHENIYREAMAEAKTRDARQSNPTRRDVWGGNRYVEAMRGSADPFAD